MPPRGGHFQPRLPLRPPQLLVTLVLTDRSQLGGRKDSHVESVILPRAIEATCHSYELASPGPVPLEEQVYLVRRPRPEASWASCRKHSKARGFQSLPAGSCLSFASPAASSVPSSCSVILASGVAVFPPAFLLLLVVSTTAIPDGARHVCGFAEFKQCKKFRFKNLND